MENIGLSEPKVSIIILNWNGLEDTIECLESLKKISYQNYEVTVVDNGSSGNDAQVLKQKFGDYIFLIENDKNYGCAGGMNIGIKYALNNLAADYILELNNDIIVDPEFLNHLVNEANTDPLIGITGPKIYQYNAPCLINCAGCLNRLCTGGAIGIGAYETDRGQYDTKSIVDHFNACMLIKASVIRKIGCFDETYFCHWEMNDFCIRAKKAGFSIIYIPESKIWHKADRTASKIKGLSQYFAIRNSFKFTRKYTNTWQYATFILYYFCLEFWRQIMFLLINHRDINLYIALLRGTRDGMLGSHRGAKYYIG